MARNAAIRPRKRAKSGPYFTAVRPITPAQASYYELLNDLSNFIGIGTLRFQMPRRAAAGMDAPDGWLWLEDHQFPKGYHPDDIAEKTRELLLGGVVRLTYRMVGPADARVRVYVLPEDVGRSLVPVNSATVNTNLRKVISAIDTSEAGWKGAAVREPAPLLGHDDETTSLFYLFNTIKSPAPNPDAQPVSQRHPRVRELLRHVLGLDPFPDCEERAFRGLRTTPFRYQRQSIAMMLQREMAPEPCIDSRLKEMITPSGESTYYVDLDNLKVYKKAFFYDDVRGGILAEEMGTGCASPIGLRRVRVTEVTLLGKP